MAKVTVPEQVVWIYESEILHQWEFVMSAVELMNEQTRNPTTNNVGKFWFGIDAALGALGNISKIFFPRPVSKRSSVRGDAKAVWRRRIVVAEVPGTSECL